MKKWIVAAVVALLAVSAADASGFVRSSFVNVNVGRSRVFVNRGFVVNRGFSINHGFAVNRGFGFGVGYGYGYGAAAFAPVVSYYYQPAALLLPTLPAVPVAPAAPAVPAPAPEVPTPTYAPAVAPALLAPLPVLAPATITYLQTVPVFSRRLFLQTHYGAVVGNRLFDRHFGVRVR